MSAPLLFLDVDGVVLPFGADLDDIGPGLGSRLAALPARLVWATAWEHGANDEIAPRLRLPRLPVVQWRTPTAAEESGEEYFNLHWKTRQVVEWADGRDFAWADDEVTAADREWIEQNHPGRALVHHVPSLLGLTGADFEVLGRWLRAVAGGEAAGIESAAGEVRGVVGQGGADRSGEVGGVGEIGEIGGVGEVEAAGGGGGGGLASGGARDVVARGGVGGVGGDGAGRDVEPGEAEAAGDARPTTS